MKDEIGGEIMKEFVGSRAKIYSYLKDINEEEPVWSKEDWKWNKPFRKN